MPKCVEHSHRSVLANVKGTVAANGFTQEDVSLDWMPLDHIGGIVMFHLVNVYTGCEQVRARTDDFIAQRCAGLTGWTATVQRKHGRLTSHLR